MSSRWKASARDGGAVPSKGAAGSVESNKPSSRGKKRRRLTMSQKVNYNFNLLQDILPRVKEKKFNMFESFLSNRRSVLEVFNTHVGSTLGVLAWPFFNGHYLKTEFQNRIPSGHSLTVRDTSLASEMIANAIFPMGHPALIQKGDNMNERQQDFINMKAIHITGFIETFLTFPSYQADTTQVMYPNGEPLRVVNRMLDPARKVRLMVVEVLEERGSTLTEDDESVYVDSEWPPSIRGVGQAMTIVGAPRLNNILEVPSTSNGSNVSDSDVMRHGRWLGIDRHYRSNEDDKKVWRSPELNRKVPFRVLHDVTFNLGAPAGSFLSEAPTVNKEYRKSSYVPVDIFLKLNAELSYDTDDSASDSTVNGSRNIMVYLFDDSVDGIQDKLGSFQTLWGGTTTDFKNSLSDEIVRRGYVRTRAFLQGNVFFTDSS